MARWTTLRDAKFRMHYTLNPSSRFYVVYIALAGITFFIWVLAPGFLWAIFLATAAFFGKEDSEFALPTKSIHHEILFFLKGGPR